MRSNVKKAVTASRGPPGGPETTLPVSRGHVDAEPAKAGGNGAYAQ